jgi:hypothetical protein
MYGVRQNEEGASTTSLQLQTSKISPHWRCTAAWADLCCGADDVVVVTEHGEVVGFPFASNRFVPVPMATTLKGMIEDVAGAAMFGATVDIVAVDRDDELPIDLLTWDEFAGLLRERVEIDTNLREIYELAETAPVEAEFRARGLAALHREHPMALVGLAWIAGSNGHKATAANAAIRAALADPCDATVVMQAARYCMEREPLDYHGLGRLVPMIEAWKNTVGEARYYLFVDAWGDRRREDARAHLEAAMRLEPERAHYADQYEVFFGASSGAGSDR